MSLHTWHSRVPTSQAAVPSSHSTLTGAELPQTRKSCIYTCRVTYVVSKSLRPCRLWPARLLCQGGGFSKQEYWRPLANTSCHTLQEHYISCCPSCQFPLSTLCCQNPCNPSSCTTSTPALTGANPGHPRQPQGQTPVDDPHAEVEIKPRGSVAKEEDPKASHQLYKLQIKST